MTITELIEALDNIRKKEGDVNVRIAQVSSSKCELNFRDILIVTSGNSGCPLIIDPKTHAMILIAKDLDTNSNLEHIIQLVVDKTS